MARYRGQVRVRVAVDRAALAEVQRVVAKVGEEIAGKALTQVVAEVSRDASWWIKSNLRPRKRTGQQEVAAGGKARVYKDGKYHVGLVGARSKHTVRDPRFGKVVPTKYLHLIEGGRKPVAPKKAKVLAIKVLRVSPRHRSHKKIPGGWQWKLRPAPKPSARRRGGASGKPPAKTPRRRKIILSVKNSWNKLWERGKKVGGAYTIFAPRAVAAPGYKVVAREQSRFGKYASQHITARLSAMVHQQARARTQSNIRRAANRLARSNP